MAANDKFGLKEVLDVTLYDMQTNKPVIRFDTLKNSSINITADKTYARGGRGNSKLITWEFNKNGTLTIEDALLSPKSFELVSGKAVITGAQTAYMRQATEYDTSGEYPVDKGELFPLTATSSGAITLAYTPSTAVSDILVYEADDDMGTPLSMSSATLSTNVLTSAAFANKKVVVYYQFSTAETAQTFTIDSQTFSGTYKLVGDTVVRNAATGKDEPFQVIIPNLKWASTFTFTLSAEGDPSTQSFECEIMKPSNSNTLVQMIKYPG